MNIAQPDTYIWSITDDGLAKASLISDYPVQGRNGQGVVNLKLPKGSVEVVTTVLGDLESSLMVKLTTGSVKSVPLGKAKIGARSLKPVAVVKVGARSRVAGVVTLTEATDVDSLTQDPQQLSLLG
ncbi:MAG: DNA gyrase C-terminal beta-propeller domain-containing protein [Chloroflexota bacterium]